MEDNYDHIYFKLIDKEQKIIDVKLDNEYDKERLISNGYLHSNYLDQLEIDGIKYRVTLYRCDVKDGKLLGYYINDCAGLDEITSGFYYAGLDYAYSSMMITDKYVKYISRDTVVVSDEKSDGYIPFYDMYYFEGAGYLDVTLYQNSNGKYNIEYEMSDTPKYPEYTEEYIRYKKYRGYYIHEYYHTLPPILYGIVFNICSNANGETVEFYDYISDYLVKSGINLFCEYTRLFRDSIGDTINDVVSNIFTGIENHIKERGTQ